MPMRLFDAHNHPRNCAGSSGEGGAPEAGLPAGAEAALCNGTNPDDWEKTLSLAAEHKGIVPCFGLHPWFADKAREGWLELLEDFLRRVPSCVGEIGLDHAAGAAHAGQEEVFRAQLRLAKKLKRPVSIHCVKAWGRLAVILKEERPPAFMLHAYGGPPEMVNSLARLGAYFSFGGGMMNPRREKMRRSLLTAPPDRLLFESEPPHFRSGEVGNSRKCEADSHGFAAGSAGLAEVIRAAARALGQSPESLGELGWRNGKRFLGKFFPAKLP